MSTPSPRIQQLLQDTKTVCFGRFVIDIPKATEMFWGDTSAPLGIGIYEGKADLAEKTVSDLVESLKAKRRFPKTENLNLYFETIDGSLPGMKHVVSQKDFSSEGMLRIESVFALGTSLVILDALPMEERKAIVISNLNDMAQRLRLRGETEVPSDPGTCINHGFLSDKPGTIRDQALEEVIAVGFRLAEFPDAHLSIYVAPANPHDTEGDSLERSLRLGVEDLKRAGNPDPMSILKVFRQDKRQIHDWQTGYEILTRTPDEERSRAHHDFWLKFKGVGGDLLRPYADIQFKTGVDGNSAGLVKPTLTDDEAIAVWDKMTSSIRVRPVTTKTKTSDAGSISSPLGTLAMTGRICPVTGWWECDQPGLLPDARRKLIREGDKMPYVTYTSEPTVWQKLKGERPSHRVGTMWTLMEYDSTPDEVSPPQSHHDPG